MCDCGGTDGLDFDLWRQLTVEHLIGESQGGYLKDIKKAVRARFPQMNVENVTELAKRIDVVNTVTACRFCNSTTSQDKNPKSMAELIKSTKGGQNAVVQSVEVECRLVCERKRRVVQWKLRAVRAAYEKEVLPALRPTPAAL